MKPCAFSVVIPTHNREHTIRGALQSLLEQTCTDWQAFVVDDHSSSSDSTEQIVNSLSDRRIRFHRLQGKRGASAARNAGVQMSDGQYVAFLDSDDRFATDKLAEMRKAIDAESDSGRCVFYSYYRAERGDSAVLRPGRGHLQGEPVGDYLFLHDGVLQTSGLVLARKLALEIPFDESLPKHQDYDLVLRLEDAGARFVFVPKALTIWSLETPGFSLGSSGNPSYSVRWLKDHKQYLTDQAQKAFLNKHVILEFCPWIGRRQYIKKLFGSGCWQQMEVRQKVYALSYLLPVRLRRLTRMHPYSVNRP